MKKNKGSILLSASDLNAFIDCRYKTVLSLQDLKERLQRATDSDHAELIKNKGSEHEARYLQNLKTRGFNVVEIPDTVTFEERIRLTQEAMKAGPDYIYQAVLWHGQWHGYVDLLKRVETPSKFGSFSYEALDTKSAKTPKPNHIIQLCVYSDLLEQSQQVAPRDFSVILRNGEETSFLFQDFAYYYATIKRQFEDFIETPDQTSRPFPCTACSICQWRDLCNAQWLKEDHLGQVANIKQSQINKLEKAGVSTLKDLAFLNKDNSIPQLSQETLITIRSQANLQLYKRETDNDKIELLPLAEGRGFLRLPKPSPHDLFFDMEGNPHHPNGLEYLFGIYYLINGNPVFKPFWAHDESQEKQAFQEVIDFISAYLNQHPEAHIYHYNHYEETALKRLASKFGSREEELDDLLRRQKLVDLYKIVRQAIRTSAQGYSIKDLEAFYMEKREGDVANAQDSIVVYEHWCETLNEELLQQISDYNEFDCRSTYLLQKWLISLRPNELEFYVPADIVSSDNQQEREKVQEEQTNLKEALLSGVTEQERPFRELITHLLEFHRREKKPQWWAMYDRQTKDLPDLLEDPDCLADLTLDPTIPEYKEKRSIIRTYRFPPQEYKIKAGTAPASVRTLERIGTIVSLDEKKGRVEIKSTQAPLPEHSSIFVKSSYNDEPLKKAIYRFANAIIDKSGQYRAVEVFLKKEKPILNNGILKGDSSLESAIKAASGLQNSYLFIQGSPGAGKTHTASRIIVELIRSGKRIGVSSNSHKAIHNLLSAIEKVANEKHIIFLGQKKASEGSSDSTFEGEFIQSVFKNKDINPQANLVAGTAWLFAEEELDQTLDYLFIDEAGQVSLANLIAMGVSAKNIVLMGDQMQLSQPIQGIHLGSSGSSTLEYLLQGAFVISPDRGIFLGTTWRMHEKICQFISDAVYEGQLHPEPSTKNQTLILSSTADPALLENGIRFIPARHQNCGQKSEEEGEIVKRLYSSLLEQQYQDRHGIVRKITPENILVISPYNVQVNYLESILQHGARVGTVDKLQGQEAEVVLFSMATSSADDLPRDPEFFYSKNRLNVAISRARTLAIVIANPNILQIGCNSIEQIRLVNTFCWINEYSKNN